MTQPYDCKSSSHELGPCVICGKGFERIPWFTQEEIEKVAKEIHETICWSKIPNGYCACKCFGSSKSKGYFSDDVKIARWHLKKMAEQKAKYERLVKAAKGLLTRTDWAPAEIDDLIEALQSLEKSESKGK